MMRLNLDIVKIFSGCKLNFFTLISCNYLILFVLIPLYIFDASSYLTGQGNIESIKIFVGLFILLIESIIAPMYNY